ncbi:MAG: peptide-methionine (R)-S-oxide reductase MsrB [Pseudomonadota bacterium]
MRRRQFIKGLSASLPFAGFVLATTSSARADATQLQHRWRQLLPTDFEVVAVDPKLSTSLDQWRTQLPSAAYDVLFEEDTERPGTSPLNQEKRAGLYLCRACELPLFTSEMKYDSGTGWPSFFTHIPGHFGKKTDFKLIWPRTEYHCAKCGGHQGHVFDDGPPPTGERWCNNGVALRFVPKEA